MTIVELGAALRARRVSSVELVREALDRVEVSNARVNSFVTITAEAALQTAAERDAELARGVDRGPLHGIPIAHKDCIFTKGVRTTWGSKLFDTFVPDRDADVITALEAAAGAVSIGKTGLHELTYGMTSNNPWFGPVRNPRDESRVAGGSSGGSAAAVAAGVVSLATGTDTGGSIRIPAAFCGVVGFKPTFDALSRNGCFPLGLTLDHLGPLTATVGDAEIAFRAMAGLPEGNSPPKDLQGVRIGLPAAFFLRIAPEVRNAVLTVARLAESSGARVFETAHPDLDALNTIGRVVQLAEAASVLGKYADRRADFGEDVLALIDQGRLIPATDYLNAQRVRSRLGDESARVWADADFLIAPATPMTAPRIGQNTVELDGGPEDVRIAGTRLTRPFNVLGWPVLSIPCGFDSLGLPIGLQLIGRPGADLALLAAGAGLEIAGS